MIDPMILAVLILAVMRLTRLAVWDKITLPLRTVVISGIRTKKRVIWKGSGVGGKLSYLAHCVFCAGFWASALVVTSHMIWPDSKPLLTCYLILAVAEVAPRLLNWEPRSTSGAQ